MTQAQPLIQTLPMTLGAPMSDDPSNPTAIEIPLQIELPNGQTLFAAVALGGLPFDGQRQIAERITAAWNAFTGVTTEEIKAPVKCLHQIAEPPQVVDAAPSLGDAWKTLLLDGSPLERDKYGCGYHPALPNFYEGVNGRKFFAVFGIELKASMAENEMESDAYEAMTDFAFTKDGPNYNVWNPERPKGEGWHLVAIFDTEDGPACWWLREVSVTDAKYQDDLAVDDLASLMKAKLAKQREKGYGGWNKKRQCTQQHLSNLLRGHVDKGDPVDVANFCAMLSARGEGIAAAPQTVQPAVPVDAVTDLKNALADATELRQQLRLMEEHARGDVWRWQADSANELASMGNRMGVLILASDLRNLLAAAAHPAEGVPAQAFKTKVFQALGIGSACDEHVVFVNIENLCRRADCLSAIEREFFMVETPPDESEGDLEPGEECLLNWAHSPEQYVKQFAEALAATQPAAQGLDAPWGDLKVAFGCDDTDVLWAALDAGSLIFPKGWKLVETDGSCARSVAIFRVDHAPVTAEGIAVKAVIDAAIAAQAKQGGAA